MTNISFRSLEGLTKRSGGLTISEVSEQCSRFGANNIDEDIGSPWFEIFTETLKDPMIWFLIGIGSLFLFVGEMSDGITLIGAIFPLLFMDAFLHWRTQASTASLKVLLNTKVEVIRESRKIEINSRDLVPGDLVAITPGVLLSADGVFEIANNIQVDESVLTGESFPIFKKQTDFDPFEYAKHGDVNVSTANLGYAGTRILTGSGVLRVLLTGSRTSYGEIVQAVSRMPHERTPLQKMITSLVQALIYTSIAFCLLLAGVRIYQGHGWLDAIMSAATLAVAAIPEEFPVVFTFFLSVGIYRLAKKHALVRRAVSVENIGRVSQICTDKTGTITVGKLTLTHAEPADGFDSDTLLASALVASSSFEDPLDIAIQEAALKRGLITPIRSHTFPFTEDRKRETGCVETLTGGLSFCTKGAPESILEMSDLSEKQKSFWSNKISEWARGGHKVIAVARKNIGQKSCNEEPKSGMTLLGLFAFEDPPRPEVADAMAYCRKNHIRVLMITGDHPDTAAAIALDSGLVIKAPIVVSAESEPQKFKEDWLHQNLNFLKSIDVVARCTPLQKLRIVTALKKSGELVLVTGDGVNDVPALKAADISIAMGKRGTRSAKEVSSIILSDDNFSTIINAIREGRQLFHNLRMSFEYLLMVHIPLVLIAAIIPLAGYPLVFLPVHIVWLEIIIHPTALLAFQATVSPNQEDPNLWKSFFSKYETFKICIVGGIITILLGCSYLTGLNEPLAVNHARAKVMAFLTLWSAGVTLHLTRIRTKVANIVACITIISSVFLIQASEKFKFLHLTPLHLIDWVKVGALVIALVTAISVFKIKNDKH